MNIPNNFKQYLPFTIAGNPFLALITHSVDVHIYANSVGGLHFFGAWMSLDGFKASYRKNGYDALCLNTAPRA